MQVFYFSGKIVLIRNAEKPGSVYFPVPKGLLPLQGRKMLDLHNKKAVAKDPRTKEQLQRRIDATDNQIERLVYELHSLTEEEIKIVEESA